MTSRKLSARARGNQRRRGGDTAGRQRLKYENRSTKGDGNYTTTRDFIGWEVLRVRAGTWWDELLGASDDRPNPETRFHRRRVGSISVIDKTFWKEVVKE